jgi:cystathionine gamma-synthase
VLEETVALLEGAKYGLAFASGMGAISALIKLFPPGSRIVVSEDLYGGTYRLFHEYYELYGYSFSWIDTSDCSKVEAALQSSAGRAAALFIETPSNPMMKVTDIASCAEMIHRLGGALAVDNTFLTPYFQNPLNLGADFVIHSGTKYLSGHNDTLSGFIVHSSDRAETALREAQKSEGASLSPFDAWLTLRGIKTLALRMEQHQRNGRAAAEWLRGQRNVEQVFYTGLAGHPHAALSALQARGHNGMVSFYVTGRAVAEQVLRRVALILFAESLGGVESLITYPVVQTHAAIPEAMRRSAGVNDRLLRLSAGIEDSADIIADLEQALA